jgi:hypothetical protein
MWEVIVDNLEWRSWGLGSSVETGKKVRKSEFRVLEQEGYSVLGQGK